METQRLDMPMDYDDNDTSHHDIHLAGEGRARSSSALRPYDFPKFDFDDSLQGHLRFESLVETEVFLGIQSQENNQWIEDFSQSSNGMEFNSTQADSCSISRRNNVWSEATSSESVEMLLKSVGPEEKKPGVSIVPESDATADQGALSKIVESSNNNTELKDRNDAPAANSDITLTPDEAPENIPASSRNREEQLENPSASHIVDEPPCGNSSNISQNALCGNDGTSANEGKHSHHAESTSEVVEEFKTSDEKALGERDSLSFPSISDTVDSDIGNLSTSKACQQINFSVPHGSCFSDGQENHVSSKTSMEDCANLQGKAGVTSIHTSSAGISFGLVPDSGRANLETNLDSGTESADNLGEGEFVLKSSGGDDTNTPITPSIHTVRPETALAISNEMDAPFDKGQGGSSMDDIVQHSVVFGSTSSGYCSSPKQMIDPFVQLPCKQDNDKEEYIADRPLKCESVYERSSLSMEVDEAPTTVNEGIGKAVLSSAVDGHKEISSGCPQDTLASEEESGAHLLADDMDAPMQVIQENLDQSHANISESEKDMCKTTDADKDVASDVDHVGSMNIGTLKKDHKTQSLEESERPDGDSAIHNLQPKTSGKQESDRVSNFTILNASTASVDYSELGQSEPAAVGFLSPDNAQEKVGMSEANLHAEVHSSSKVEISLADDTVQSPICKISTIAQQHVEKIDGISSSVPSSMTKENADLVSDGVAMTKEGERESGQSAVCTDIDKTSCGSPTIISSSEPSQIENDIQEEGRGYQVTNELRGIQTTSEDLMRKDSVGDDSGFTFKVNALPDTIDRESGKNWSPFPDVEKTKVLEETAVTASSRKGKTERMPSQKAIRQNAKVFEGETGSGTSKGTSERKGRRGSAKGATKDNVKRGNQSKGPTQENASLKVEKVSNSLLSPLCSQRVTFGQMQQQYGNVELINKKPSDVAVATTNLPDLNSSTSSTSSSPPLWQPFSDLQQVQLRAQIFVYGSLIQGIVPDEACMVSAFGQYEGGRGFWERTWRATAERVQNQKSPTAAETPHSQSCDRASDAVKQNSHTNKVPATPVSRANKETPAPVLSPVIPLSSPLWNISTPQNSLTTNLMHKGPVVDFQHTLTPVHSYQTSPIRTFVGHTSWPSQTGFPSPWLASPQTSSFNSKAQLRPVTMTETVKLTPVKDTSAMLTSSGKHTTSSPAVHTVSPSPALGAVSPLHDTKSIASAAKISVDAKPRKRKKVPTSDPARVTFVSEAQTGSKMVSSLASLPTTTACASTPASLTSDAILSKSAADASTISSIALPKKSDLDTVKGVTSSEEMLSKVAEAKSQAEDAAALANAAVTHCEDLWGQLAKHKDSGLTSESEVKLASSAAAIAAAASIAKAAAATAKIAFNAALQVKLMAEEAVHSCKIGGVAPSSENSFGDMHNAGNATPSFLMSNSVTNQSRSILVAAKEAAKRRVEAASAASKQAANLDAIVKAAELAAAVVSQAGKIVAMGEPLPLKDLIEAGPEGYWKLHQPSAVLAEKVRDRNVDQSGAATSDKTGGIPARIHLADTNVKGRSGIVGKDDVHLTEGSDGFLKACSSIGVEGSKHTDEKDFTNEMDNEISDTSESGRAEIVSLMGTTNAKNDSEDLAALVNGIKEGSYVEVFNPRSVQKSAWYPAKVLKVEKGKAYVLYNDLLSEEGSGNIREWVPLESEGDKAPIIRVSHSLQHQKPRKRRRAALSDYVWCVGDRVDVWIDDGWWEGVVTEKNEKDETTLKVHISARGETSIVKAWNLRASHSWINGEWIAWSSTKGQNASEKSDTPQQKRQRMGPLIDSNSKDMEPNNLDSTLGKPEQFNPLTLSTSERAFDVGKTTTSDNKQAAHRPLRTNQQKQGSRVVFGVPKPTGKKRKFMEVSKHFPANKTDKGNDANNSVKFAKYLMPQGPPTRGWKVPTRNDTKEKQIIESRPRVLSTRKAQRTLPQRENSRSKSARDVDNSDDQGTDLEYSASNVENISDKTIDHGSAAFEEAAEAPLSSLLPHSLSTTSKKISSSNSKSDRQNRGRLGPSGGKLSKIEEDKAYAASTGKSTLDDSEPRRSNRRIQPTHRLLEGLESSMAIPKMPAVSHDKSRRNLPARGK